MENIQKPNFELEIKLNWFQSNAPISHTWGGSRVLPRCMEINSKFPVGEERDRMYILFIEQMVTECGLRGRFENETKHLIINMDRQWEKVVQLQISAQLALNAMIGVRDIQTYWDAMNEIDRIGFDL